MFVLYGTATCTRAKPRTNVDQASSASSSALSSDVSTAHMVEQTHGEFAPSTEPSSARIDLRYAMLAHDYVRARGLVDGATEGLQAPTLTLLRGFLALRGGEPMHALEQFDQLGGNFRE